MRLDTLKGAAMASPAGLDLVARVQPDGCFTLAYQGQPLETQRGEVRTWRSVQAALRFAQDHLAGQAGGPVRLVFEVQAQLPLLG